MEGIIVSRNQKTIALISAFFITFYIFQNFEPTVIPGWHDKLFFPFELIFILAMGFDFFLYDKLSVGKLSAKLFIIFSLIAGVAISFERSAIQYLVTVSGLSELSDKLVKLDFVLWTLLILSQCPLIWSFAARNKKKTRA